MRESAWSKAETLDRLHNYLESPVFPWNVLFEPLPEDALEHYAPFLPVFHFLRGIDVAAITRAVRATCQDYMVNPDSPYAQAVHRGHVHEYPFAYSQLRVFGSLQREGTTLFHVVDVPGVARLLGRDADDIREMEAHVARLAAAPEHRPRLTGSALRGKTLVDVQGAPLGLVEDLLHEGDLLVELRVRPQGEIPHPEARKIGESLAIPLEAVSLWSPFHDTVILRQMA